MALTIWALGAISLLGLTLAVIGAKLPGAERWERRRVIVGVPLLFSLVAIYLATALLSSVLFPEFLTALVTLVLATSCIAIVTLTILRQG